jgi:K+-transporting ATPase A subunit
MDQQPMSVILFIALTAQGSTKTIKRNLNVQGLEKNNIFS